MLRADQGLAQRLARVEASGYDASPANDHAGSPDAYLQQLPSSLVGE